MRIRLIDVDGHNFPNIPLMKISAYYKNRENDVAWYDPLTDWHTPPDKVFMSKVFTFTPDYPHPVCGKKLLREEPGIITHLAVKNYQKRLSIFIQIMNYIRSSKTPLMDF